VWTLVAIVEARWRTATVLFILLLGMKENLPIIFCGAAAYALVFNGLVPRKRAALALLIAVIFFGGCYFFEFRTHNRHVALLYQFADFDKIYDALDRLGQWRLLDYFWLPAAFTPILALPALGELSLELMGNTNEFDWHSYTLMALVIVGTLFAGIRLLGFIRGSKALALPVYLAFIGFLVAPVVAGGCYSYWIIERATARLAPLADAQALQAIRSAIPPKTKLATTSELLTFCADRRYLIWPQLVVYADYILVNRRAEAANRIEAEQLAAILPYGDDAAGGHFRADLDVVLSGYGYDANLISYVDRSVSLGTVVPVKSIGSLTLYHALAPQPGPPGSL
jgi:FtsH-binding integral membrane protein